MSNGIPSDDKDIGVLSITRKPGEGIIIGDLAHVIVTQVGGGQARLVIRAPRSVLFTKTKANAWTTKP